MKKIDKKYIQWMKNMLDWTINNNCDCKECKDNIKMFKKNIKNNSN
jgi:hypothetical protein